MTNKNEIVVTGNKHSALEIPGASEVLELAESKEGRQSLRRILAVSSMAAAFWMLESAKEGRDKSTPGWENLAAQSSTSINSALRALKDLDEKEPRKKGGIRSVMSD